MAASRILIAGAGIGGLAAALALARIGLSVTILERSPRLDAIGAGVQLSPNATRVLAALGVLDRVMATAFEPEGIRVRGARTGATMSFMSLRGAERRWGAPYAVAHRADLQDALRAAIEAEPGVVLHLGTALAGFGTTPGGVTVTAKQSLLMRQFDADALIGADGVRSIVRAKLVGDAVDPPLETGRTAWRASIAAEAVDPLFAAPETGLWLGRDAHLVHYPLRGGRLVNVVAITGDRTSADPNALWSKPGDPRLIEKHFASWHQTARALIGAAPAWQTWPLFDRAPLPSWNAGPIALLGDAAHPILPFLAQGAGQAIEDAATLADAMSGTNAIPAALAAYSRKRQPRATKVQETSRRLGRIYHLGGPLAVARDTSMRILGPQRLLARYDWLYGA